ncbi:hypothetical protein EDC01DRAFT_775767 [Geopyxis carbonaria]|nr:hypothetical protein EDC01DRAFT_775767 [Geopyxis carbonaria]
MKTPNHTLPCGGLYGPPAVEEKIALRDSFESADSTVPPLPPKALVREPDLRKSGLDTYKICEPGLLESHTLEASDTFKSATFLYPDNDPKARRRYCGGWLTSRRTLALAAIILLVIIVASVAGGVTALNKSRAASAAAAAAADHFNITTSTVAALSPTAARDVLRPTASAAPLLAGSSLLAANPGGGPEHVLLYQTGAAEIGQLVCNSSSNCDTPTLITDLPALAPGSPLALAKDPARDRYRLFYLTPAHDLRAVYISNATATPDSTFNAFVASLDITLHKNSRLGLLSWPDSSEIRLYYQAAAPGAPVDELIHTPADVWRKGPRLGTAWPGTHIAPLTFDYPPVHATYKADPAAARALRVYFQNPAQSFTEYISSNNTLTWTLGRAPQPLLQPRAALAGVSWWLSPTDEPEIRFYTVDEHLALREFGQYFGAWDGVGRALDGMSTIAASVAAPVGVVQWMGGDGTGTGGNGTNVVVYFHGDVVQKKRVVSRAVWADNVENKWRDGEGVDVGNT